MAEKSPVMAEKDSSIFRRKNLI